MTSSGWMLGWSVCTQVSTTAAQSLDVDNNQSFSAVLFPTNGCSDTLCYYGITSHMEITLMDNKHFYHRLQKKDDCLLAMFSRGCGGRVPMLM